jgi:hypothetical protein
VILLIDAIIGLPPVIGQFFANSDPMWRTTSISTLLYLLLTAVIAVVFLMYAGAIAERLATSEGSGNAEWIGRLENAAFGTLGLYFLVVGIRASAGTLFVFLTKPAGMADSSRLVEMAVEIIAGAFLFFRRNGIAAGFRALRTGTPGVRPED